MRHRRQHAGDKAFHVRRAAAIQLAVSLSQRKWRDAPVLPVHRHHIAVAGEHHATAACRAKPRIEIGFAALGIMNQLTVDAEIG